MTSRKKVMVKVYVFFEWPSYMMEGQGVALSSRPNGENSKGNIKVVNGGCLHMQRKKRKHKQILTEI